uniref:Tryptophan synthase n=1 Tax=Chloropicon laureae TaxID=464258 RepID=A0A7S3E415_9CHLO
MVVGASSAKLMRLRAGIGQAGGCGARVGKGVASAGATTRARDSAPGVGFAALTSALHSGSSGSRLGSLLRKARPASSSTALRAASSASSVDSVSERMAKLKEANTCALIPFIVAGDPDLETTALALEALSEGGADVIELGVPYSDPLADGPTIQAAATRALEEKHTTLDDVLAMLKKTSPKLKSPVVLFTYYNPILKKGIDAFCAMAKDAGAAGLLVPDLPLEETDAIRQGCEKAGLENVLLVTPTTPKERMSTIANASQGFVYLVSLAGVTGTRTSVAGNVEGLLKDLQSSTDKSVAVGFGVSSAEQAQLIKSWGAEGVIVGSALVKQLGESGSPAEGLANMKALLAELRNAL